MPFYEYCCDNCKANIDIFSKTIKKFNDIELCPICGKPMKKLINPFNVIWKKNGDIVRGPGAKAVKGEHKK